MKIELFEEDTYLVDQNNQVNLNLINLFEFYQPIVGANAISLYLTLLSEASFNYPLKHERLCKLTKMSIDDISENRHLLEKYGLLKSFYNEESRSYIYLLLEPLSSNKITNHYIYGLKLKNNLGLCDYELNSKTFINGKYSIKEYKDISLKLSKSEINDFNENGLEEFIESKVENVKDDGSFGFSSLFDYQKFMSGLTKLTFPLELRTNDNLRFIGRVQSICNLSYKELREFVCQSIDYDNKTLNHSSLLTRVLKNIKNEDNNEVGYSINPLSFLKSKQEGVSVSSSSIQVLEYLVNDTYFSTEVINIIVEFCLNNTDNRLVKSYVEQVAETFARNNIKTEEDALNFCKSLKKETKKQNNRFINITKTKSSKENESKPEDLDSLRDELLDLFKK